METLKHGGIDMYNIVIGISKYGEMIIDLLRDKDKLVIAMDKKDNLRRINNKKIIKHEVNTNNVKLVENEINNLKVDGIYIVTEDDSLNLMLGEQLSNYENVNVLLSEENIKLLTYGKYNVICPVTLVKEDILRGMK